MALRHTADVDDELLIGAMIFGADDEPLYCVICGKPLDGSIDDQPNWPSGPMCGNCYQSQQMDDEIDWSNDL